MRLWIAVDSSRRTILEHGGALFTMVMSENREGHSSRTVLVLVTEAYRSVWQCLLVQIWWRFVGDSFDCKARFGCGLLTVHFGLQLLLVALVLRLSEVLSLGLK